MIVTLFMGAAILLIVEILLFKLWISRQDVHQITPQDRPTSFTLEHIVQAIDDLNENFRHKTHPIGMETASFLNIVMSFMFQEMKDDAKVRAIILNKINIEIADVLTSRLKSKFIKTLKVHNFSAGTSPPILSNIHVNKVSMCKGTKMFKKVHITTNIEYKGCGKLAMQASTMFGKNLYISVEVTHLIGTVVIVLNRNPHTHWGFCFESEPNISFNVISSFERRSLPKLTKIITSILKMVIRKKHTKPNYRKRYNPFFKEPLLPINPETMFYINAHPLNKGQLIVKLISANRIANFNCKLSSSLYCTISLGQKQWDAECCPLRQTITFDTTVSGIEHGIGLSFKGETEGDGSSCTGGVVVEEVNKHSPAHDHVKPGDVVTAINNKRVTSFRSALAASLSATNRARLSISRPVMKWNKIFTSGDAFQDMAQFDREQDSTREVTFVEEEEFLVLKDFLENEIGSGNSTQDEEDGNSSSTFCLNQNYKLLKSSPCSVTITPYWDEYFMFTIKEAHKYLTVCLWRDDEEQNPVLLGYNNISLMEIALNCISTTSKTYNDSTLLSPPRSLRWQEDGILQQPITSVPPLTKKLKTIAGEVRLQYSYFMDKDDIPFCQHSYVISQLQDQDNCALCQRKIVHNSAYICVLCSIVIHQNCLHLSTTRTSSPRQRSPGSLSHRRPKPAPTKRQRARTAYSRFGLDGTAENRSSFKKRLPSFFFLKGAEKKVAVLQEELSSLEVSLSDLMETRSGLLSAKSQCQSDHVPTHIVEELFSIETTIENLMQQKAEIQVLLVPYTHQQNL